MRFLWAIIFSFALTRAVLAADAGLELYSLKDPGHELTPELIAAQDATLTWEKQRDMSPSFGDYSGTIW